MVQCRRIFTAFCSGATLRGKDEAPDWFQFSVPLIFAKEMEKEAWAY